MKRARREEWRDTCGTSGSPCLVRPWGNDGWWHLCEGGEEGWSGEEGKKEAFRAHGRGWTGALGDREGRLHK